MSDEYLRNRVKELSMEWKKTRDFHYIQEAIHLAKQIKNGQAQTFLEILHVLAERFRYSGCATDYKKENS